MESLGNVEVSWGKPYQLTVGEGESVHLVHASLRENEDSHEPAVILLTCGKEKLVVATLRPKISPEQQLDIKLEKSYTITTTSKKGRVVLYGILQGRTKDFSAGDVEDKDNTELMEVTQKLYFDVKVAEKTAGTIVFGLFGKIVPRTAENFTALCTGMKIGKDGRPINYEGSTFRRCGSKLVMGCGYLPEERRTGRQLVDRLDKESLLIKHDRQGLLSMGNDGLGKTSGSRFFITLRSASSCMDGRNVVFGKVLEGMELVNKIDAEGKENGVATVLRCGEWLC